MSEFFCLDTLAFISIMLLGQGYVEYYSHFTDENQ